MTGRTDFIIIANAWSAGRDNPTSKHRIALELAGRGHRVLWVEGSGMRAPSMGSGHDRLRMVRKVGAALRGVRREEVRREETLTPALSPEGRGSGRPSSPFRGEDRGEGCSLWVLSPLFIPLPRYEFVRRLNGLICRWSMRFWGWRLGFRDSVLINYVPVLAEAMRRHGFSYGLSVMGENSKALSASNNQEPITNNPPRAPVRAIYHCVDRWDQFGMYDSAMMGEMDRRCCVYADLVLASSSELYERCLQLNPNTVLITHGVDWEHFREAVIGKRETEVAEHRWLPTSRRQQSGEGAGECVRRDVERHLGQAEMGKGGAEHGWLPTSRRQQSREGDIEHQPLAAPVIGFFGLLSEWVDQDLILRLAREFPQAIILLIGKPDVDVTRLQGVPNIHLPGPKPFFELPAHIARFTVGVIPFVVNDLTRAVNPIKLREMLAAGCPVVATALPEVEKYARMEPRAPGPESEGGGCAVCVAHDHDEFVAMVRNRLAHPLSGAERQALSDSMAGETWSGKVDEILSLIG